MIVLRPSFQKRGLNKPRRDERWRAVCHTPEDGSSLSWRTVSNSSTWIWLYPSLSKSIVELLLWAYVQVWSVNVHYNYVQYYFNNSDGPTCLSTEGRLNVFWSHCSYSDWKDKSVLKHNTRWKVHFIVQSLIQTVHTYHKFNFSSLFLKQGLRYCRRLQTKYIAVDDLNS